MTEYTAAVAGEHRNKGARKVFRLGDIRLYECPLSYLTTDTAEIMRAVYMVEGSAALLNPGGWSAQPHWFVEGYEMSRAERAQGMSENRGDGNAMCEVTDGSMG